MEDVLSLTREIPVPKAPPNWKRFVVLTSAILVFFGIGLIDYATGWELSLFVFYAVPILFVVWQGEKKAAIFLALLCGIIWWLANESSNPYQLVWSYQWASLGRLVYFLLVAIGGNALYAKQDADRARIVALQRAQRLEIALLSAVEREQQRIGRDLHDGLCQQLAAIGCAARSLADDLRAEKHPDTSEAEKIESYINDSVIQARNIACGILPVISEGKGLVVSLGKLASTTSALTGLSVTFCEEGEVLVDDLEVAMHLYRITQEALSNAVRHSGARVVTVSLGVLNDDLLRLSIVDDGDGLPADVDIEIGLGFKTMSFRARAINARLSIARGTNSGTKVECVCNLTNTRNHGDLS